MKLQKSGQLMRDEITVPCGPFCVGSCSLTPNSIYLLEKLVGSQLFKELVVFYGSRKFFTVFTRAHH
jgi:hypothetical protein